MKITGLSLDSQLAILCQVSSRTLLTSVPLVYTRWNQLQPYACRQRRTLNLRIQKDLWKPQQPKGRFTLYPAIPLNAPYAVALCATFPRVTHLDIFHWDLGIEELDQQLYLLQSWTSTLVSLQLANTHLRDIAQESSQFNAFFDRLLVLLNQMPRLKRLYLSIYGPEPPSADLSILRRLGSIVLIFRHSDHHFGHHLVSQLQQHCSSNLQRLCLGTIFHFTDLVPLLTSPAICSKLDHLTIGTPFDATQLSITFDQCTNLRSLELFLPTLELYTERLHPLTKLPRLIDLTLQLFQLPIAANDPVPAPAPLPVLSTIRRLTIYIEFNLLPTHEHLAQVTRLDEVFPQLQQIRLYWPSTLHCQHCQTNGHHRNSCIDALLRPLARLETLNKARVRIHLKNQFFNWLTRLRRQ